MNHLPAFLIAAGALAMPAAAETYGEPPSDARAPLEHIKVVPRPAPAAHPAAPGTAAAGAAMPAAEARTPPDTTASWDVTLADKSIRSLLTRWCKEANYQLLWEVSVDLEIGASATITGNFEDALTAVLSSLSTSAYPVEAMIYDNRVVRVVKRNN